MNNIIDMVRSELKQNRDEAFIKSSANFFREGITLYGVKTALVDKIANKIFKNIKDETKTAVLSLCKELWKSGYLEDSFIASRWAYNIRNEFEKKDILVFEHWIGNYVNNWASCDTLCNHTVGSFLEMYPESIKELKKWAKSENRWLRRASSVSLIIPAKNGYFLKDIIELADILLLDNDDLVQKGYGWMLKSASHAHKQEVFDYVMSRKEMMPRTALRYAIEKLPEELKRKAMEK